MARMVKNLPEIQETWVRSLGWEDPLEKGMATQSTIMIYMFAFSYYANTLIFQHFKLNIETHYHHKNPLTLPIYIIDIIRIL